MLTKPTPILFTIQEHHAKRAGKHYDIRIVPEGSDVAYSFATKKDILEEGRRMLFPQPFHDASYATWEGTIREGYGAGKVKLKFKSEGYAIPEGNGKLKIVLDNGKELLLLPYKNAVLAVTSDFWNKIPKSTVLERAKFKETFSMPEDKKKAILLDQNTIATEKIDGANVFVHFTEKGPVIVSRRISKNGKPIVKTLLLPQFRGLKPPKELLGTVVNAELYHDKGFNFLSGILNSKPSRAVRTQLEHGPVKMALIDLPKEKLPYGEKLKKLKEIASKLNHPFITTPKAAEAPADKLRLLEKAEEGVVVGHKFDPEAPFYKIKKRLDFDLQIVNFEPGKRPSTIGALVLADKTGRIVGRVGTGFSEEQRKEIFQNWKDYKGRLAKVQAMLHPHRGTLRAPVFLGFTTDKNEPDEVPQA